MFELDDRKANGILSGILQSQVLFSRIFELSRNVVFISFCCFLQMCVVFRYENARTSIVVCFDNYFVRLFL